MQSFNKQEIAKSNWIELYYYILNDLTTNKEDAAWHLHVRLVLASRAVKSVVSLRAGCALSSQPHYAGRLSAFQPSFHESREAAEGSPSRESGPLRERKLPAFYSGQARRPAKQSADANRRWFTINQPARAMIRFLLLEVLKARHFLSSFSTRVGPVIFR
jgi:hypothetical protein